jgi:hypothetical protein
VQTSRLVLRQRRGSYREQQNGKNAYGYPQNFACH